LFVIDPATFLIILCSENTLAHLSKPLKEILGQDIELIVGKGYHEQLQTGLPTKKHFVLRLDRREIRFWIKDDGISIHEKDFDQIFVMFKKLNDKKFEGTGIGPATCKSIVERHGSRIWFESVFGEGATSHFTIPNDQAKDT
jgi:signal transduction histidine kinase